MKKLKLFHIALGDHNQGLWRSFEKYFDTTQYNWIPLNEDVEKLNREIMKRFNKIKPDVVFMQIQKADVISISTAKKMTKKDDTIQWTGDVRFSVTNWLK